MNPNYREWLGDALWRSIERSRIGNVIFGLNLDDSLCNPYCFLVIGLGCNALPHRQSCTEHGSSSGTNCHLNRGFHTVTHHRSPTLRISSASVTQAGCAKFRSS
jgi:hypothetical protein